MGKKAKVKAQQERLKKKRAKKEAQKAKYAAFRDAGKNQKSKRFRNNTNSSKKISTKKHVITNCGNPGCKRCHPINFNPFLDKNGEPKGMPNWMYQEYMKVAA